jgi:flagellar basal body-associated protein FliL
MAKLGTLADDPVEPPPPRAVTNGLLLTALIGLIAAVVGFAMPQVLTVAGKEIVQSRGKKHERASESKGQSAVGNQQAFVPFGDVVVNLAEERLTRYLRVNLTLLVDGANETLVRQAVETKRTILKDWLISYLSDKGLDEVRGAAGVNRSRREIQDHFNGLLFPDGSARIRDVLFEEFTVQ